ncbi:MAG TPA: protein kinase, partial [Acidimicrobiales bacterium]|nr:protein kinase [Acidimicrobiales bacterium]
MHEAPAPEVIADRYELGTVLGRGGMGEVRDGLDRRLGRPVAVKLLRRDLAADPELRRRFEGEARAAARLAHPNVVAVHDTGEQEGVPYIVMERLAGRTVADEIAEGPLEPARVQRLGREVLAALDVAHRAGTVHRDIKPANLLLTPESSVKVADFGIAKAAEALPSDVTASGQVIGTPAYLAPERLEGAPATARSDLYSLAVVLYEALSGTKP